MSVGPINPSSLASLTTPSSTTSGTSANLAQAQKNEFMRLLVAQLRHQDPLDPAKGADFVAQLAQFSALEQNALTNDKLDKLATAQTAAMNTSMAAMVGKTASARSDRMVVDGSGAPQPVRLHLEGSAKTVTVNLIDSGGAKVRTIELGATAAGDVPIDWTQGGKGALSPGSYRVEVVAKDSAGADIGASTVVRGQIQALSFNDGSLRFRIAGTEIAPGDIVSIEH